MAKLEMPPTPRSAQQVEQSELIPFKSTKINLKKSPIVVVVAAVGLLTLMMWMRLNDFLSQGGGQLKDLLIYVLIALGAMLTLMMMLLFVYSRSDKPALSLLWAALVTVVLLTTPVWNAFMFVFRQVLPGGPVAVAQGQEPGLAAQFISMFFGAGLCEELFKAIPVLLGAWIGLQAAAWRQRLPQWAFDALVVRNPLDGMLLGMASGAGFIFLETGLQYTGGAIMQSRGEIGAVLQALLLLIPRTTGGFIGHIAYSGIVGYFIGLAVLRPNMPKWVAPAGWVAASALHALWNSSGAGLGIMILAAAGTGLLFVSCFLKARQLSALSGHAKDSYGSIVASADEVQAIRSAERAAAALVAPASFTPIAAPAVAALPTPAPAAAAALATAGFDLLIEGRRLALRPDQPLNLAQGHPQLGACAAEVSTHPSDPRVLGLRNLGQQAWTIQMPDGKLQTVASQRNVRLVAGMVVELAPGVRAQVMPSGA